MKNFLPRNHLVAIAIATVFSAMSNTLLADDSKTKSEYTYPGYHMGAGMMGGGYGMGRGMMGEGAYMWPGMMGGYGMGPGMMGGYGQGHGMMGGRMGLYDALDLTDEQQTKINKIQDETRKSHWSMMGEMMDQQAELRDLYSAPKQDTAAIDKTYKKLGQLQQKMYESNVEAQKRIETILSKEQQEKLRTYSRRGW